MGKTLIIAVLLAVAGSSTAAAERDPLRRDADAVVAAGVTGVQVRVSTGNTVCRPTRDTVATSGVADLRTGRPVRPDGHFRMGSTTKTFVATVVLQLVGDRKLRLDDPVERWLPGVVRGNGNDGRVITVRHLLQHTSGINDDNYPTMDSAEEYHEDWDRSETAEEVVAAAMELAPRFTPPGSGWAYSNTGYVVLGMVIEKVTGRPWHAAVTDRIVRPLCLSDTYFPGDDPDLPRPHAHGYQQFEADGPLVDVTRLVDADASGGLVSTTADVTAFFRALLSGLLLRAPQLAEMLRDPRPLGDPYEQLMPGAGYGLGIFRMPLRCGGVFWMHPGGQNGFSTNNGVTPDGRRAVTVSASATLALAEPLTSSPGFVQERRSIELVENALCR